MFSGSHRRHRTVTGFDNTPRVVLPAAAAAASCMEDDEGPLPPPVTSTLSAVRSLLTSIPSMRQLDDWAARITSCPPLAAPVPLDAFALERRLEEATVFARAWQALRTSAPTDISQEHTLLEAYFEEAARMNWLYMDQGVYTQTASGGIRREGNLLDILAGFSCSRQLEALARVGELVHETYVKEHRCLQVDHTRIQFQNATAMVTAAGWSIVPTPALAPERPIVPRAYVRTVIDVAEHEHASWQNSEFLDVQLHVFVGAMLRPGFIRCDDIRPVLLLATSPTDVIHPLVILAREFCDLSVVTCLPKARGSGQPWVLLVEALFFPVTEGKMADIHTALSWGMVVIVHTTAVPPVFYAPQHAFARLVTVHVPWAATPFPNAINNARHHILPATQASYQREDVASRRHLSFLATPGLLRYRLPAGCPSELLVEMLQCSMGVQHRRGKQAAHVELAAAYAAYAVARGVEAAAALAVDTVMEAVQLHRDLYGHLLALPIVTYAVETATYFNLLCA